MTSSNQNISHGVIVISVKPEDFYIDLLDGLSSEAVQEIISSAKASKEPTNFTLSPAGSLDA